MERCKIIWTWLHTCMLHILQWLSWSKNTSPTLITSSLLHPLIFTLQIFLIYPRIWFVHSLLLIPPPPLSFQQFTKWLGLIILNHGMNKLPWRGLFIKTVVLTQEHMLINNLGSGGLLYGLNDKMTYYVTPRKKTSSWPNPYLFIVGWY